jgi:class 3 adenylate cyclase/TolB-like protein/Flp pilus assembly protein TadD
MKQPVQRRLAAILAADVAGYSRLMGADEEGTFERLKAHRRQVIDPKIKECRGRIVKTTGDGLLVEFPSVVDAVRCAAEIQRAMIDRNADPPDERRIRFRVGINLGDIIAEGGDIFGDGVNVAARLEALAEPGGICISRVVYDQVRDKFPYPFEDLGEQNVKNIARPVGVFALGAATIESFPHVAAPARPEPAARRVRSRRVAPRLSIVVLPFANLSSDPEQEYFVDAITDDLTTDLSRIVNSFVISRTTAFTYKGKAVDVRQIGRELAVRYVLEGSVRRLGEQVQVNVQLIDAESGAHIWADRFDTDRTNLAKAQSEITLRLAQTLRIELVTAIGRRIEQDNSVNLDANDLIMRGWASFYRPVSAATLQDAQHAFEQALRINPESVNARVGIATVLNEHLTLGWSRSREQDIGRSDQLLRDALDGDRSYSWAHQELGRVRRLQGRLIEAQIEFENAIALDRNNIRAVNQLAITLIYLGRPEAAIPHLHKVLQLDPRYQNAFYRFFWAGYCHLLLDRLDEAIDFFRKGRAADPQHWFLHSHLAAALALRGDTDEARTSLAEALRLEPRIASITQNRDRDFPGSSQYAALREKTLFAGLRRAGLPDE